MRDFLGDYQGYLLSDGYSAYDTLKRLVWRMLGANLSMPQKASPSKKAGKPEKTLSFISKLYALEQRAKHVSAKARQQLRRQESLPILNDVRQWLDSQQIFPKSAIGKATTYAINQWPKLLRYELIQTVLRFLLTKLNP